MLLCPHRQFVHLIVLFAAVGVHAPAETAAQPLRQQSLRNWPSLAEKMVDEEIVAAGVTNERVIRAMRETPRHEFMPSAQRPYAYYDMALAIGEGQTISPPFVVAYMTQELDPQPGDKVLEIGTGSGYQAAVLSPLVAEVYSIEIVEPLARRAARTLRKLDYDNVHTKAGDGYLGWPQHAPFDKIIVTCSPEEVPQPLVDQLAEGGRMVIPVGERYQQNLYLFRKENGELKKEALRATLFVPMTGTAEANRDVLPDPLAPQLVNGGFEGLLPDGKPSGWHYQRQLSVESEDAPAGESFARFENKEPGRGARALQGFAVDGRSISALAVAFDVRGNDIRYGQDRTQWPAVIVTFYDERRQVLGEETIGPFRGSFDWHHEQHLIQVPLRAREAILRLGLLGAVGQIDFDQLEMTAVGD